MQEIVCSNEGGVISGPRIIAIPATPEFLKMRDLYKKRRAIRNSTEDLLEGRPTRIMSNGQLYTIDHVLKEVCHHSLFPGAAMASFNNNPHPLKDLIRRVAQHAISEHLCPGESIELGFLK